MPSVLNAANEVAVEAFLNREISIYGDPRCHKENDGPSYSEKPTKTSKPFWMRTEWAREKANGIVHSLRN